MTGISRRKFVKWSLFSTASLAISGYSISRLFYNNPFESINAREALFYRALNNRSVECLLCNQDCVIKPGKAGLCRVRFNRGGSLYSAVYANPAAVVVEPVEKEPLYHYLPGSNALCVGTTGCSFTCLFCQNWQLSQRSLDDPDNNLSYTPQELVKLALNRGVPFISFTYNEPTIGYEYLYDTALEAREQGIKILMHTNAFIKREPLNMLLPLISACVVDLKSFNEVYYRDICGGSLAAVLDNLVEIKKSGVWLEVVNLVVPGLNDQEKEISEMCSWLTHNLGTDTPLHLSRFYPAYRLADLSPTPVQTLERAYAIAKNSGLDYVTLGNVPGHQYNSTFCPQCESVLVQRKHVAVEQINIENGNCSHCGKAIAGVWS